MQVFYVPDDCEVTITKKTPCYTCRDCEYFKQHYVFATAPCRDSIDGFTPVNYGHCTYPRLKNRKPGDKACQFFEARK